MNTQEAVEGPQNALEMVEKKRDELFESAKKLQWVGFDWWTDIQEVALFLEHLAGRIRIEQEEALQKVQDAQKTYTVPMVYSRDGTIEAFKYIAEHEVAPKPSIVAACAAFAGVVYDAGFRMILHEEAPQ